MSGDKVANLFWLALVCLIVGCGNNTRIDLEWHKRDLTERQMARWIAVAPTESGFMRTAFDRNWKPKIEQPGYLTEQARLIYSMSIAYEVTSDKKYLSAAMRGADFLLANYSDPANGGLFLRVSPNGEVISAAKNTYAHAFALLALSHVARLTKEARYRAAALQVWRDIDRNLRDSHGGFFGEMPRDFSHSANLDGGAKSQNPLMHMFEALIALHEATNAPEALKGAKEIADFVIYHLLSGGSDGGAYIPEWFDAEWKPLPTRQSGGYVDLGHQFEWVHMLLDADKHGLPVIYSQTALRILKFGLKTGYDEIDGGVYTKMYPDGQVDRDKYWWQQTEGVRAFMTTATIMRQNDMWRRYEQTIALIRDQFVDPINGGWYSRSRKQCGGCPDDQPDPYHMISMHRAALSFATTVR